MSAPGCTIISMPASPATTKTPRANVRRSPRNAIAITMTSVGVR
jgi:hypothetical protein